MTKLPGHRIPRNALTPAPRTPIISLHNTARNHRTIRRQKLPGRFQAKIIKAAESGQVRAIEGSFKHEGLAVERSELDTPILVQGQHLYTIRVLTQNEDATSPTTP